MVTKEFKVAIPKGMEIDKENSTFECIKFKKVEKQVKTWSDLKEVSGYFIDNDSSIRELKFGCFKQEDKNVSATEKHCKMMLAIAQISQLMPYYGGEITDEEWNDNLFCKYVIERAGCDIIKSGYFNMYSFLAFHTQKQRDEFLKNNEQLVKDYLML